MKDDEDQSAGMSREPKLQSTSGSGRADEFAGTVPTREIDALDLLGDRREAVIVLYGSRYKLRITSGNKLILTK